MLGRIFIIRNEKKERETKYWEINKNQFVRMEIVLPVMVRGFKSHPLRQEGPIHQSGLLSLKKHYHSENIQPIQGNLGITFYSFLKERVT
jgi:hypothetical protein